MGVLGVVVFEVEGTPLEQCLSCVVFGGEHGTSITYPPLDSWHSVSIARRRTLVPS